MIRLIAAVDKKGGIAKRGFQPWYIPADEKYFTDQTKSYGGNIVVGSTTYKTFNGPLTDRHNYILTSKTDAMQGAEPVHDLAAFIDRFQTADLWVVGGANVFNQVIEMGKADELYLTHIEADFGCDQFFPANDFTLRQSSEMHEENGFVFRYAIYSMHG